MQNTWRRAGAMYGAIGQIILVTVVAALLAAGITLPAVAIIGIATRDVANTFDNLPVGTLGDPPAVSTVYASTGQVIASFYPGDIYRVPVSYDQIDPVMRNAIVSIEDSTFWQQGALDPRGTARALFSNSSGGQLQGASTIAQQYVKNVLVLQAGTNLAAVRRAIYISFARKIAQLRIAATVEHQMTQQQLLAAYLNVAYFGEHAYGIQVAAERYFSVPASQLTLTQAADLAGIVQSPLAYDPHTDAAASKGRRNAVLARMWQLHYITRAQAAEAEAAPIVLNMSISPLVTGCLSPQVAKSAFFCDYVQHVLERNYPSIWNQMITGSGGLKIYTTLNMRDQIAANKAVSYVQPDYNTTYNPGHNADTEVLIQPGTGAVRAIAINRVYGTGYGKDLIDYAVNSEYGGSVDGVQTGSSSKIFTLIAALKTPGYDFGHPIKVVSPSTVGPYYNCQGQQLAPFTVINSEGIKPAAIYQLYNASVGSINVYFANLEKQVGLCQTVKTAVDMGMTRADGTSLLKADRALGAQGAGLPADDVTSFTLGSIPVSPMSMAAAYASVAARGRYCAPDPLVRIVTSTGTYIKLTPDSCHQIMPRAVADAANYILRGVLYNGYGTANMRGIGRPLSSAAKTGTANGGYFAAFAGYTRSLAGYVSVFNPTAPTTYGAMVGPRACFRDLGNNYPSCDGQMYGWMAPGATWEYTFLRAAIGPDIPFVGVPGNSPYFNEGYGDAGPKTCNPPKKPRHGAPPTPTPTPTSDTTC